MSHVFISYVHENREITNRLRQKLESSNITTWIDSQDLPPGARLETWIREAIQEGAFFIACFSNEYHARERTFMNIELDVAINELRQRPYNRVWFIPVKLNDCEIPDLDIGGGETLRDLVYVNLYENWDYNIGRIQSVIQSGFTSEESDDQSSNILRQVESTRDRSSDTSERNSQEVNSIIENYSNVIDLNPRHTEAYKQRGILYFTQERYELSLADFNMIIELDPRNIEAYELYCLVNEHRGAYAQALLGYNRAISMDPKNARLFFNRGRIHTITEDREQALLDYNKTIELDPKYAKAYFMLGAHYRESREYDLAFENLNKVIELDPQDPGAYYERALIHRQKDEYDLALVNLNKAIELDPQDNEVYFQRALTYLKINEYDLALQDLDKAIELAPERDNLHFYRGQVLSLLSVSE